MGATEETVFVLGETFMPFRKLSEIRRPDPVRALVFVDESINSVDDGFFAVQLQNTWMNSPTSRHHLGCVLSFADGHSERWKWQGVRGEQDWWAPAIGAALQDLRRMQEAVVQRD
jgi:hypothetical protein